MNKFKIATLVSVCFLFSCSSDPGNHASSSNKNNVKVSDCLAGFDYDYSKLLTKEDVLKHVDVTDPSSIKMKYDNSITLSEYGECAYTWDSDRPELEMKIAGMLQKAPDQNRVVFSKLMFQEGSVEEIQERFNRTYKSLTAEEVEEAYARLEESYKDKPEKELETAKGFVKARSKMNFQAVDGLGDFAYWSNLTQLGADWGAELIVLVGKVHFTVQVKVSEHIDENVAVAIDMAKEVIGKCH